MKPEIIKKRVLGMNLCIPKDWSDEQIIQFAENENPCGTELGWCLQKDGDTPLMGCSARIPCDEKEGFIHVLVCA